MKRTKYKDRRSGNDRRNAHNLDYFLNNGVERRIWKERRSPKERRTKWIRVDRWWSFPFSAIIGKKYD